MGGDHGPSVVVPAAATVLAEMPQLHIIFVGDQAVLQDAIESAGLRGSDRVRVQHASQQVAMDELPSIALRTKKDSSMRVAINLVKAEEADACVSAGNTGALMATAKFVLKTLPGIDRPAILGLLPNKHRGVRVLDLGANVDCSAEHLVQFAVMGSVVAEMVDGVKQPRVGLLNIGAEEMKGNEQVKQTAQRLMEVNAIHYIGYVESDDIFMGEVDVVVCDGFVGNVALKAGEGIARLILHYIRNAFNKNWLTKLASLPALPVLKSLGKTIDPARYNGASFVGLRGTVIKSHGGANILGFAYAIREAVLEVENNVSACIQDKVSFLLQGTSGE